MNITKINRILRDTDYVHTSGTEEERKTAEYLLSYCEALGAQTHLEDFEVPMSNISKAVLTGDGREIPCTGYKLCGSGQVTGPFLYLPNTDKASLLAAKGKIVLVEGHLPKFYEDLLDNGALAIITANGNVNFPDHDIDTKEQRASWCKGRHILMANIHAKDAVKLVENPPKEMTLCIEQEEYTGRSCNAIAELPGKTDEWICLSAHYDTVPLSHGSYDNMTGCIGLIGILEEMVKKAPHRYGLRFIFCGSEERGLLGSKAYVADHEEELSKIALNINLDMIGSTMGNFIACCSAEESLVSYLQYLGAETGWGIHAFQDVYSSDSTPFADKGVPALSFARLAGQNYATIHNRYDTIKIVSAKQTAKDIAFIASFTGRMADAVLCPVPRTIPDSIKEKLDTYLFRKK